MRGMYMHLIMTNRWLNDCYWIVHHMKLCAYSALLFPKTCSLAFWVCQRLSLKGMREVLFSCCGFFWLELTGKLLTASTLTINIPENWEIYFGNKKKPSPQPLQK